MPFLVPFNPAIIGAGATVVAGAVAAGAANHATDAGLAAQNSATSQSLAAQKEALDRITGIQQPFIDAGQGALGPLGARVGAGAPNFSAPGYARPQVSAYATPPANPNAGAPGGQPAPVGTGKLGNGTSIDPASAGPSGVKADPGGAISQPGQTEPDWEAYIAANPDIAQYYSQTPEAQTVSLQDFAKDVSQQQADIRGPVPTKAVAAPQGPQDLGTASPVVANYFRPDQGTSPDAAQFIDPSKFTQSPGYQFRLDQGLRNTNAKFGAKGLLQSGAALQGFNDYAQNSASAEYNSWFNQQQQLYQDAANRFNNDRNNSNQNYADDRSYGTNLALSNRDFANNQYNTQTQNMFQLANVGANAANAISGAVTNNGNQQQNLFTAQGNNAANAAYSNGATASQFANSIGGTVANLFNGPSRFGRPTNGSSGYDPVDGVF